MIFKGVDPEIEERLVEYAEKVRSIFEALGDGIKELNLMNTGKAMSKLTEAIRLDTEADNLRREILKLIGKKKVRGGFIREAITRLVRRLDITSEWGKEAARYLTIVPYLEIPADLRDVAENLAELSIRSVRVLVDAIKLLIDGQLEETVEKAHLVEEFEEAADSVLLKGRRLLIEFGEKEENAAIIILTKDFIEALENVTDFAEDAADYLRSLVIRAAEQ